MSTEGKRRKLQEKPDPANNGPDSTHTEPGPTHHGPDPTHTEPRSAHHGPNLSLADRVSAFSDWCSGCGIVLSDAVYISTERTAAQYGVLSRRDLAAGEVVATIPRSALLSQHSTRIQDLLEKDGRSLVSDSGWVPLLLSLMYEATDRSSPWTPYFELWPQLVPPDLPMFWTEEERAELLAGTGVMEAVSRDIENIQREYQTIVLPFIQRHPQHFHPRTHTLNLYMRLVAFVMAYSFQESMEDEEEDCGKDVLPPMMVPVADLFNHVAQHNTHLEYTPECLKMITIKPVPAGAELFNTYGQMGNWQLLHMYGFSEQYPHNINESADIQMSALREAALQGAESEEEKARMWARWSFLCRMEMVGEEGAFVFTSEEVLTDDELKTSLKVLCMSDEEFAEYKENDGWEEDDGDEDEETFTVQKLASLPSSWRRLLHNAAALAMKAYATPLRDDQSLLDDPVEYAKLSSRAKYSLHVRYGQKRILERLMTLTTS